MITYHLLVDFPVAPGKSGRKQSKRREEQKLKRVIAFWLSWAKEVKSQRWLSTKSILILAIQSRNQHTNERKKRKIMNGWCAGRFERSREMFRKTLSEPWGCPIYLFLWTNLVFGVSISACLSIRIFRFEYFVEKCDCWINSVDAYWWRSSRNSKMNSRRGSCWMKMSTRWALGERFLNH